MTDQNFPPGGSADSFEGADVEVPSDQAPPPVAAAAATANVEAGDAAEDSSDVITASAGGVRARDAVTENDTEAPHTEDELGRPLDNPSG